MPLLDPAKRHPMVMPDGTVVRQVVHLKAVIDHPRIAVGEFSYYHHFEELPDYAAFLAPYLFPLSPEKLVIGKFVQIAHGVRFITSSANHDMRGLSTYPFTNFTMTPETTRDDILAMFQVPGAQGRYGGRQRRVDRHERADHAGRHPRRRGHRRRRFGGGEGCRTLQHRRRQPGAADPQALY